MKMVMISYNESIEVEVMEVLQKRGVKNYTKILQTFGRGETSGTHLGTDIWPGRNNILYVACSDKQSSDLLSSVKELRKSLGEEGVKAFVLPLEEMT